jgi:hypothetical protein
LLGLIVDIEDTFGVVFEPESLTAELVDTPMALWQAVVGLRGEA